MFFLLGWGDLFFFTLPQKERKLIPEEEEDPPFPTEERIPPHARLFQLVESGAFLPPAYRLFTTHYLTFFPPLQFAILLSLPFFFPPSVFVVSLKCPGVNKVK